MSKKNFLITFEESALTMMDMYCKAMGMSRNELFNNIGIAWYIENLEDMKKVIKAATKNN